MADANEKKSALRRIAEVLFEHRVEFIIIGGQAETLMGSARVTYDVDICYRRTPENLDRLAEALRQLNAKLRNVPPDVPFVLDARTLRMGNNFTFHTALDIGLDILGFVEPIGEFDQLLMNCETFPAPGGEVFRTIGLDDLIRVKTTIKRFKDGESIVQLLAIKNIRDQTGQR